MAAFVDPGSRDHAQDRLGVGVDAGSGCMHRLGHRRDNRFGEHRRPAVRDHTAATETTPGASETTIGATETTVAATPTTAAAGEAQQGGSLQFVALNDLASLDNSQAVSTIDYDMTAGALYEGLYHFTSAGELEPGLATGPPEMSDDGLVYTFTIEEGAMFAGPDFEPRAVIADDVAYGMIRALDPNTVPANHGAPDTCSPSRAQRRSPTAKPMRCRGSR